MKKQLLTAAVCAAMALCGCSNADVIGIIGGEDGPTAVYVTDGNSDKTAVHKRSIRLARIDGVLYYDTEAASEAEARCGTLDGALAQKADSFEVPQNDGECNFTDADGYQFGTEKDTVEIPVGGTWNVFKKIDTECEIAKYNYCCVLGGRLPNAACDSEFLVLSNEANITFEDAAYQLFGADMTKMKDIYVIPLDTD